MLNLLDLRRGTLFARLDSEQIDEGRKEINMDRIKTVLAPTDLSDLSLVGVRHALEIAQSQGGKVIVYHVADYRDVIPYEERKSPHFKGVEEFLDDCKKRIDQFLRRVFPELILQVELQLEADIGIASDRIVEKAAKEGVDMIVMSTHGRTGLSHMLIGSVTEQIVRRADCPVFSVRPQKETRPVDAMAG